MLRRTPSLALRAAIILLSVNAAIFLAFVALIAVGTATDNDGELLALEYAAEDIRFTNDGFQLPGNGRFARLAAKNPAMWLIVQKDGRTFTVGSVPHSALETVGALQGVVRSVQFRLPDQPVPLAAGALKRRWFGTIAAGGVNPASLSPLDSILLFVNQNVIGTFGIVALISLLASLVAIPFFSRAVRPVTRDVSAIGPQDSAHRLDERKAPRELLPLVRGFNAALDRLAAELGRRKRFIADAAHELRTPLAVVSLRVEALKEESAKQELRRSLDRVVHIVSQMLDLERLSLSAREQSTVDLVTLARDVVADLAPTAISSGYDLSLHAPDDPVTVTGDPHAISRAITNLIANAITHGGRAGQIAVTVGSERSVEVADEGPGVPAEVRDRLFDPFTRGSQSTEGCGLGLHLTREIMRAHGGEVELLPAPRGATFRLTFP